MQVELTVPTSWETVTLRKYLAYLKDAENYKDDEEAVTAATLMHFCGIQPDWLSGINISDLNMLKYKLNQFINNQEHPLQRKIFIDGQAYGFEPNLSTMTYGAYLDITKWDTFTIDDNWAKIMNILYRPVEKKSMGNYSITKYDGGKGEGKWLDVPMSIHFGALFFLFNLLTDLLSATLKYSMAEEVHPQYKKILERSGEAILQLLSSQITISPASTLFLKNL